MVFQTGPILVFASLVEICLQPAWSEPRRARRNGQSCAYEAPGMAHGDVDMPDVHEVSNCESRVLLTVVSAPPEHITQCTTHCTQHILNWILNDGSHYECPPRRPPLLRQS